jgi:hypothetical protein
VGEVTLDETLVALDEPSTAGVKALTTAIEDNRANCRQHDYVNDNTTFSLDEANRGWMYRAENLGSGEDERSVDDAVPARHTNGTDSNKSPRRESPAVSGDALKDEGDDVLGRGLSGIVELRQAPQVRARTTLV